MLINKQFLKNNMHKVNPNQKSYRKGHFMGIGMAIGIPIGFLFGLIAGIILNDMTMFIILGPGGGVALGISIGTALEAKYNPNPRPSTPEEKRMMTRLTILLTITALIGLAVFLYQMFL
jgi:MFS family permease